MDTETRQALEESIAHHERLLLCETAEQFESEGYSGRSCALCRLFINLECNGCPVKNKSGFEQCRDTPYLNEKRAIIKFSRNDYDIGGTRYFITKEIEFLKSLREDNGL
jgi:hypothetical protein